MVLELARFNEAGFLGRGVFCYCFQNNLILLKTLFKRGLRNVNGASSVIICHSLEAIQGMFEVKYIVVGWGSY